MREPTLAIGLFVALVHPLVADGCVPVEVVVSRVGDGETTLDDKSHPGALVRYSATGSLLATYPLPIAAAGDHSALTLSGSGSVQGLPTRSTDGRFVLIPGYATAPGTTIAASPSALLPRVVGRVDASGTVDASTDLDDFADEGLPNSAVSTDGVSLWVAGSTGGVRHALLGDTSSTPLAGTALRQVAIFGDQLYVSDSSAGGTVGAVGIGLPTTEGQGIADLFGLSTDQAPTGFSLFDLSPGVAGLDTLYVADALAGIQKWTLSGPSWVADGVVGNGADLYRGLAATVELGVVSIFAVRLGSELVRLDDASGFDGALTGSPALLASAPANTRFRGVALAPLTDPVGVHCDDFESGNFKGWSLSIP